MLLPTCCYFSPTRKHEEIRLITNINSSIIISFGDSFHVRSSMSTVFIVETAFRFNRRNLFVKKYFT